MSFELEPGTRFRVSNSIYSRPFGKEIVLLDFGRGEYFALDEVGAEIWQHLAAGKDLVTIAKEIAAEFEVSEQRALDDIFAIVRSLQTNSLVEAANPSGTHLVT